MPKAKKYPYSYETTRKIRGEHRKVTVTKTARNKESLKFKKPKERIKYKKSLTREEAREVHRKRTKRAKVMDSKKTVPIDKTTRWKEYPDKFDYPEVDTKGRGHSAGEGRKAGRKLRHKKPKKPKKPKKAKKTQKK